MTASPKTTGIDLAGCRLDRSWRIRPRLTHYVSCIQNTSMTLIDSSVRPGEARIIPQNLHPIRTPNLPQMVADKIVDAIGDRRILSGQRIFELELAEQLAISRVPV